MPGTRPEFLDASLGCPRARDIFGTLWPRPKRLLAPSLVDFRGNPGIRAMHFLATSYFSEKICEHIVKLCHRTMAQKEPINDGNLRADLLACDSLGCLDL